MRRQYRRKPATQDKQSKQANCPAVALFPTTAPTIYIQKHKTSVKNKIAGATAQRTEKLHGERLLRK